LAILERSENIVSFFEETSPFGKEHEKIVKGLVQGQWAAVIGYRLVRYGMNII
jgi:hypothetical protein